ncbi:hypothetical protein ACFC06_10575 [Nocardia sp. NPDC056064]|uniref:hypothetical protein n=1 Tax=Nocardia sp. NPDC056064 TaxID=3345701 RepID=UPI0035D80141
MTEHPLQPALDRTARALWTTTDLLEIAMGRKPQFGRSDARQTSLYRAAVTASVGVVEEATESLVVEALRSMGLAPKAVGLLASTVSRVMGNPNSDEIRKLMSSFLGYDPVSDLRITLRTSEPAFRMPEPVGTRISHQLWTIYNRQRSWSGSDAAIVLNRFVKIRNSFAHQDSSVGMLAAKQPERLRLIVEKLRKIAEGSGQKLEPEDKAFIEQINASSAVRVLVPARPGEDPIRDWRLHETHAVNALLTSACVVSSLADGLANHLDSSAGVRRDAYDPLYLNIDTGSWVTHAGDSLATSPCGVDWVLTPYAPRSRT